MTTKVKLQTIIEEMSFQLEETSTYLNMKTGEIISVKDDDFREAEELDSLDHLPEWQQEALQDAFDILENSENYQELPTKYDINEFNIIEKFCYSLNEQDKQVTLRRSIQGKGAFRRFKDQIRYLGLENQWYSYQEERYKEIAIGWCQDRGVDYEE